MVSLRHWASMWNLISSTSQDESHNRNIFSHSLGAWKSKLQVVGRSHTPLKALGKGLIQVFPASEQFTWLVAAQLQSSYGISLVCLYVQISSLYNDTGQIGLEPTYSRMISSSLIITARTVLPNMIMSHSQILRVKIGYMNFFISSFIEV